ncbi:hypothetical protein D9M69_518290 [compost metagenome]
MCADVHQPVHMLTVTGAGDDFHMRIELAHQLGGLDVGVRVVGGDHEVLGFPDLGRVEDFRAHRVAVEHRHATKTAGQLDGFHRGVEGHELDVLRAQNPRNDLAHATHAGDHHPRRVGVDFAELLRHFHRLHFRADQPCAEQQQQRGHGHGQGDGQHQQVIQFCREQPVISPDLEYHKGKFTTGRQHDTQADRADVLQASGQSTDDKQQRQFDRDQQQGQAQHRHRHAQQQTQVRPHADTDEKQPE